MSFLEVLFVTHIATLFIFLISPPGNDHLKILLLIVQNILTVLYYWTPKSLISYYLSNYYPGVIYRLNTDGRKIMLTIDDVPYCMESFEAILNELGKYKMKVVFFVISDRVNETNRYLLIRALKDGHRLENHGKTDQRHSILNETDFLTEINTCEGVLNDLYKEAGIVRKSKFFRPGCGTLSDLMINKCKEFNMKIMLGNNYPHDNETRIVGIILWYIIRRLEPGDIIIIHDKYRTPELVRKLGEYFYTFDYETVI